METRPGGVPRDVSDRPKPIFYSPRDDGMALVSSPAGIFENNFSIKNNSVFSQSWMSKNHL